MPSKIAFSNGYSMEYVTEDADDLRDAANEAYDKGLGFITATHNVYGTLYVNVHDVRWFESFTP